MNYFLGRDCDGYHHYADKSRGLVYRFDDGAALGREHIHSNFPKQLALIFSTGSKSPRKNYLTGSSVLLLSALAL